MLDAWRHGILSQGLTRFISGLFIAHIVPVFPIGFFHQEPPGRIEPTNLIHNALSNKAFFTFEPSGEVHAFLAFDESSILFVAGMSIYGAASTAENIVVVWLFSACLFGRWEEGRLDGRGHDGEGGDLH